MKLNQQGFAYALNIIRPKWNVEIILQLTDGSKRFNEIWSAINGISAKSLTKSLKHLEECGIIYRKQYPEVPPHVEYSLTAIGRDIEHLLSLLNEWGTEHHSKYDEIMQESPVLRLDFM